jgi:hypothetical protein
MFTPSALNLPWQCVLETTYQRNLTRYFSKAIAQIRTTKLHGCLSYRFWWKSLYTCFAKGTSINYTAVMTNQCCLLHFKDFRLTSISYTYFYMFLQNPLETSVLAHRTLLFLLPSNLTSTHFKLNMWYSQRHGIHNCFFFFQIKPSNISILHVHIIHF